MLLAGCDSSPDKIKTPKVESQEETLRKNGNALIVIGNFEEAVNIFDRLIKLDPKNIPAYNGKAIAFDSSGNHLAAQEIYKTALSISPNSLLTKNNLAISLMLNHQTKQAVKLLEPLVKNKANQKSPYIEQLRYNLALAYAISEQHKKADELDLPKMNKEEAEKKLSSYKKYNDSNDDREVDIKNQDENIGFIASPHSATQVNQRKTIKEKTAKPVAAIEKSKDNATTKVIAKAKKPVKKPDDSVFGGSVVYSYPN